MWSNGIKKKKIEVQCLIDILNRQELISLIYIASHAYLEKISLREAYDRTSIKIEILHHHADEIMREEIVEVEDPLELCEIIDLSNIQLQESLNDKET
ncbi:hypothetical protein HW132_28735 [Brasilonema sp. CT11]|nr:hypothetical protein [Brasilonema sp. CT11]